MIAGETQAMTDVSEMAQKLMSTCEGAMTIISCADTESDEHDTANAAFDEAATHFEELGYVYEMTLDWVVFSRSAWGTGTGHRGALPRGGRWARAGRANRRAPW
jgi:hypothetical protein